MHTPRLPLITLFSNVCKSLFHFSSSPEKCMVKMSKKKPLWLVWNNPDPLADIWFSTYKIMFKNGDGEPRTVLILFNICFPAYFTI